MPRPVHLKSEHSKSESAFIIIKKNLFPNFYALELAPSEPAALLKLVRYAMILRIVNSSVYIHVTLFQGCPNFLSRRPL